MCVFIFYFWRSMVFKLVITALHFPLPANWGDGFLHAGTDPEDVIRNAFACFDEDASGHINEDR